MRSSTAWVAAICALMLGVPGLSRAQQGASPPTLRAGGLPENFEIDGVLNEPAWDAAEQSDAFTQSDPLEGASPSGRTMVRVLARPNALLIGIVCDAPVSGGTVSFSVRSGRRAWQRGPRADRSRDLSRWSIGLRVRGQPERGTVRRARSIPAARTRTPTGTASGKPPRPGPPPVGARSCGFRCRP